MCYPYIDDKQYNMHVDARERWKISKYQITENELGKRFEFTNHLKMKFRRQMQPPTSGERCSYRAETVYQGRTIPCRNMEVL